METFLQYAVICPLVMLAGFVDAIAGGGGLISLPGYLLSGLPVHNAIATNKMSSTMGTVLATFKFAKSGFIPWKLSLSCVVCAFAGSSLGANLALLMDAKIFMIFMLIVLPATGLYLTRGNVLVTEKSPYTYKKTVILSMVTALFLGVYDGFYGLPLKEANGVTKVINSTTNIAALCIFLLHGKVLFPLGIIAGLFGMAGNYLGALYFEKGGARNVKPIILLVLSIFFCKIVYEMYIK